MLDDILCRRYYAVLLTIVFPMIDLVGDTVLKLGSY